MSDIRKVVEDDGTYSVMASDRVIRGSMTAEEADDVITMLAPMDVGDE